MQSATSADSIELSTSKISTAIVMVSSEAAKRWLAHNKKNRNISEIDVERYANDMANGLWQFAADPIRFDVNGNLLDGQHRLTALARLEDVTIPLLVIRGLPTESQMVMDQGRKRTPGQQLGLRGVKDANLMAAIFKVVMLWETGLMFRDSAKQRQITTARIEEYIDTHPVDLETAQGLANIARSLDAPPSTVGAFAVIASRKHPIEAARFLRHMHSMTGMAEGHPAHTLDRRLRNLRKQSARLAGRDYLALFILAFNAFVSDRSIRQLSKPAEGWSLENYPKVVD